MEPTPPPAAPGPPVGIVLLGTLLITAPQLPALLSQHQPLESFAVRVLAALLISWAGCEVVYRVMHHYAVRNALAAPQEEAPARPRGASDETTSRRDSPTAEDRAAR